MTDNQSIIPDYLKYYRYHFNGMEKDDEIHGNSYDFGARMYDPRLGKFLKIDAQSADRPFHSPYMYAANAPVWLIDLEGNDPEAATDIPPSNVIVIIPSAEEVQKGTYNNVAGRQGAWHVIIANDMVSANAQFQSYTTANPETAVNNLVVVTHGTLIGGQMEVSNGVTTDANGTVTYGDAQMVTSQEATQYNNGTLANNDKAQLDALKAMCGGVSDGGDVVLSSCTAAKGEAGRNLMTQMHTITGTTHNLYMSQGVTTLAVDPGTFSWGEGKYLYDDIAFGELQADNKKYTQGNYSHTNTSRTGFLMKEANTGQVVDLSQTGTGGVTILENPAPTSYKKFPDEMAPQQVDAVKPTPKAQ